MMNVSFYKKLTKENLCSYKTTMNQVRVLELGIRSAIVDDIYRMLNYTDTFKLDFTEPEDKLRLYGEGLGYPCEITKIYIAGQSQVYYDSKYDEGELIKELTLENLLDLYEWIDKNYDILFAQKEG